VLQSSLQPVATGRGLLQPPVVYCQRIALCCNHRCNRLQRAEVRCKLLCSVATDGTPLQQVVMRCNQSGCGVAARATGAVSMSSALRLNSRQQVAPGLWSVAAGCGQLQHGTALQQIALACITVVVRFSQQVRLRHSKLHCVATGISTCRTVATRCNKWSVDLFCNRIVRCCNMRRCNRLRSRAAVLRCRTERCRNTRYAVATDCALVQQFCVVALSAVATRDALLQRMGNRIGCVVAQT
jgi:hypothetical protein